MEVEQHECKQFSSIASVTFCFILFFGSLNPLRIAVGLAAGWRYLLWRVPLPDREDFCDITRQIQRCRSFAE